MNYKYFIFFSAIALFFALWLAGLSFWLVKIELNSQDRDNKILDLIERK